MGNSINVLRTLRVATLTEIEALEEERHLAKESFKQTVSDVLDRLTVQIINPISVRINSGKLPQKELSPLFVLQEYCNFVLDKKDWNAWPKARFIQSTLTKNIEKLDCHDAFFNEMYTAFNAIKSTLPPLAAEQQPANTAVNAPPSPKSP
jgi:hypothetical protein